MIQKRRVRGYIRRDGKIVNSYNRRVFSYNGNNYKIKPSNRKNKQLVAINENNKKVHFGDPNMREYPGTKREDNYCARSFGIKDKDGKPTRNNPNSANFWSRRITWQCQGKRGKK